MFPFLVQNTLTKIFFFTQIKYLSRVISTSGNKLEMFCEIVNTAQVKEEKKTSSCIYMYFSLDKETFEFCPFYVKNPGYFVCRGHHQPVSFTFFAVKYAMHQTK